MSSEHIDVALTAKQSISLPFILQTLTLLAAIAGVYSTLTSNDREYAVRLNSLQAQVDQIKIDSGTVKGEIRGDLRELKEEIREMRQEIRAQQRAK